MKKTGSQKSRDTVPLKVVGNKKQAELGRRQILSNGLGPSRSRVVKVSKHAALV
jgi:hypothetical protein